MPSALTKYVVALYSVLAGVENALQRLKPHAPYKAGGDVVKKSVKELTKYNILLMPSGRTECIVRLFAGSGKFETKLPSPAESSPMGSKWIFKKLEDHDTGWMLSKA
ncbi:hypothetical protein N7537_009660 [Penicillium hordei]|uniref:Uncharacterized protein n=1 Tax=Penicillium hordei TaxID=40994 RepID=A0AAD6GUZ2_9EURO|nr:uncharacterized protein N7537_009660 [Penicillium hordei]KAJ5592756.1 hypothetical protein N7537_009660 [Penicillium hordei]